MPTILTRASVDLDKPVAELGVRIVGASPSAGLLTDLPEGNHNVFCDMTKLQFIAGDHVRGPLTSGTDQTVEITGLSMKDGGLVSNPSFGNGATGYTLSAGSSVTNGVATLVDDAGDALLQTLSWVNTETYIIVIDSLGGSGTLSVAASGTDSITWADDFTKAGRYYKEVTANATYTDIRLDVSGGTIDIAAIAVYKAI